VVSFTNGTVNDYQANGGGGLSVSPSGASSSWTGVAESAVNNTPVDTSATFAASIPFGSYALVTVVMDGSGASAGGIYLNDSLVQALTQSAATYQMKSAWLGCRTAAGTPTDFAPLGLARLLVYSGVVSETDRATIHSWVRSRWPSIA
jgi:hypothetical protein